MLRIERKLKPERRQFTSYFTPQFWYQFYPYEKPLPLNVVKFWAENTFVHYKAFTQTLSDPASLLSAEGWV